MKKTLLILCFSVIVCAFNAMSQQTLTPTPTTVENNGTVTLTGVGETIFRNFKGNISFSDLGLVTTPTGYRIFLEITELKRIQEYDNLWSKPSKFSFKIKNSTTEDVIVTIPFKCTIQNSHPDDLGIVNSNYMTSVTFTVRPTAPTIFYNDAKSPTFYKNNCGSGFFGSEVVYPVPANKYSSLISKADANAKAQAEIDANGQNHANSNGQCMALFYNTATSITLSKNNCPGPAGPGLPVTYPIQAGKYSAKTQAAADQLATNDLNANGQNYANEHGTCADPTYNSIVYAGNTISGDVRSSMSAEVYDPTATYTWQIFGGILISGQGNQNIIVKPDRNTFNGPTNVFEVRLTFTNSFGTRTISRTFSVPPTEGEPFDPGEEILP